MAQEPAGEFDVLVFFRADRIVRRLFDLADLIRWSQSIPSPWYRPPSHSDLSKPFGDIIALLVAKVAEMELAAICERNASAARYNIRAGKYRGGMPPWGYLPQADDEGDWRLVQDPEQVGSSTRWSSSLGRRASPGGRPRPDGPKGAHPEGSVRSDAGPRGQGLRVAFGSAEAVPTRPTLLGYIVTREPLTDAQGRIQRDSEGKKTLRPGGGRQRRRRLARGAVRAELMDDETLSRCAPLATLASEANRSRRVWLWPLSGRICFVKKANRPSVYRIQRQLSPCNGLGRSSI